MKYRESLIPKTKREMLAAISDAMLRTPRRQFPEWEDSDGAFYCMIEGMKSVGRLMSDEKAAQVLDMIGTAKGHYECGDNKLGGGLMEDIKAVIMNRRPWAYPASLYRWTNDSELPEVSESDILNKDEPAD